MKSRLPFRNIEPTFFAGLFDDPVLLIHMRPLGKNLLIDCGQIHHLAKRLLKATSAIFISHAHMDHFMGIDSFIRNVHVSPRTFEIFGPPGLAAKVEHKLAAYDWNLAEFFWASFLVHDVLPDRLETSFFPGPEGFTRHREGDQRRCGLVIYRNEYLEVEADQCDHKIPALIYRITERQTFYIDEGKIEQAGLVPGEWLRQLKKLFHDRGMTGKSLVVLRREKDGITEETTADAGALYEAIRKDYTPAAIGYVTDIGFTEENLEKVLALMKGVSLFLCECSFLAEERENARETHHLCTSDINLILDRLRPPFFLPMHHSKNYTKSSQQLYEQLHMPPGTTLLRIPDRVAPRPYLISDVPKLTRVDSVPAATD